MTFSLSTFVYKFHADGCFAYKFIPGSEWSKNPYTHFCCGSRGTLNIFLETGQMKLGYHFTVTSRKTLRGKKIIQSNITNKLRVQLW